MFMVPARKYTYLTWIVWHGLFLLFLGFAVSRLLHFSHQPNIQLPIKKTHVFFCRFAGPETLDVQNYRAAPRDQGGTKLDNCVFSPPGNQHYPTNGKGTSSSQLPLKGICEFSGGYRLRSDVNCQWCHLFHVFVNGEFLRKKQLKVHEIDQQTWAFVVACVGDCGDENGMWALKSIVQLQPSWSK